MPWDQVMHKWKTGTLKSGGPKGPPVSNQKQAIAIMLSEKRKSPIKPEYQSKKRASPRLDGYARKKRKYG